MYTHILIHTHTYADELIRQITIECAERGLLLLRIRDEARMRIAAYQTLYESRCVYVCVYI
jgi:dynein light intermediate chain